MMPFVSIKKKEALFCFQRRLKDEKTKNRGENSVTVPLKPQPWKWECRPVERGCVRRWWWDCTHWSHGPLSVAMATGREVAACDWLSWQEGGLTAVGRDWDTHTHTHIEIPMYGGICVCVCVWDAKLREHVQLWWSADLLCPQRSRVILSSGLEKKKNHKAWISADRLKHVEL